MSGAGSIGAGPGTRAAASFTSELTTTDTLTRDVESVTYVVSANLNKAEVLAECDGCTARAGIGMEIGAFHASCKQCYGIAAEEVDIAAPGVEPAEQLPPFERSDDPVDPGEPVEGEPLDPEDFTFKVTIRNTAGGTVPEGLVTLRVRSWGYADTDTSAGAAGTASFILDVDVTDVKRH